MEWEQRRQDMGNGYKKQESWWVHKILKRMKLSGRSKLPNMATYKPNGCIAKSKIVRTH